MPLRSTVAAAAAFAVAASAAAQDARGAAPEDDAGASCLPSGPGFDPDLVCRLPTSHLAADDALAALAERDMTAVRDGDELTLFARYSDEGAARLCCSLQGDMERVGDSEVWAARYRLAELDRAMLTFVPPSMSISGTIDSTAFFVWRGPDAPPAPAVLPVDEVKGEIVDRTLWSEQLQETRRLQIYLPPGYDPAQRYPGLFRADGLGDAGLIEALIDAGAIPPIVVVGIPSGQRGIVEDRSELAASLRFDLRSADYLPRDGQGMAGERFEQHMSFVADDVVALAVEEFSVSPDPADRIVHGYSNGGTFALWAGLLRPDAFGIALPMSSGWGPVTPEQAEEAFRAAGEHPAQFLTNAGLYEVGFHYTTSRSTEALRAAGFDAEYESLAAGHMSDQWEYMLAERLVAVLGTRR